MKLIGNIIWFRWRLRFSRLDFGNTCLWCLELIYSSPSSVTSTSRSDSPTVSMTHSWHGLAASARWRKCSQGLQLAPSTTTLASESSSSCSWSLRLPTLPLAIGQSMCLGFTSSAFSWIILSSVACSLFSPHLPPRLLVEWMVYGFMRWFCTLQSSHQASTPSSYSFSIRRSTSTASFGLAPASIF